MSKRTPIVAIASLLAGTAMAGVVVYMERNPMAFTSASVRQSTPSAPTARAPVYLDEAVDEEVEQAATEAAFQPQAPKAVTPAPVRKLARKPAAAALPAPVAAPVEVEATPPEPCTVSEWRRVGFKENGQPRHVRAICP